MLISRLRDDRGVTMIFVAITLLVLMGFAAIAVDYGLGVAERRLDQNTADTAALSGGVELIVSGDPQVMVDTIKTYVDNNLNRAVPASDWSSCTDSGALAFATDSIPGITGGSECISLGESSDGVAFARLRVRIPDQTTETTFARLLGVVGLTTSAAAEVQLEDLLASGAFPAAVFSGAGAGDFFCIKTGTASSAAQSCGDPSTGDFGNFVPYFYTEVGAGNPSSLCTSGNQPAPLSRTMADGIDHFLGISSTPLGNRRNGDNCPSFPGPLFPDRVDSGSGNSNSDVTNGLVKGGNFDGSFTGRLTRQIWGAPFGTATVFTHNIDNRPLWSYIDTGALDAGGGLGAGYDICYDAAAGPTNHTNSADLGAEAAFLQAQTDLEDCLQDPDTPGSIFHQDLYESPRLTIVPRYWESGPIGNNSCCYNIKAFVPVFIDGIWTAEGSQWTCDGGMVRDAANGFCKHEPGRSGTIHINSVGNQRIDSAGAYVLNCDLLPGVEAPEEKCKKVGVGPDPDEVFLNLYLVK